MKQFEDLDFYELLGIAPDAGRREIDQAYEEALQTYGAGSLAVYSVLSERERERAVARIEQAYAVLSDDVRRSRYDEQLGLTGNAARAAVSLAEVCKDSPSTTLWGKVRQVLPSNQGMGARVSRILGGRGSRKEDSGLFISSGRYLESVRKLKGVSLEEISETTKIKLSYLKALEDEDYETLPSGVYRRYILKALAVAIDLDPEAVAEDFQKRTSHR